MSTRDMTSLGVVGICASAAFSHESHAVASTKSDRLGKHRWVVERTHAWLAAFGKLRIHFERCLDIHIALLTLACAVISSRFVEQCC
ncbi:hypothetical protein LMG26411_07463 [Cupriavidus numazuensis]|uniref:Transposase IS4-like domain-containing protein n=1 Tax=Cupriavidus numazuensis TaxID=221992 RepID=A0ABM8TUW2_9BURK|nr:hypothetical protein LMG26411_07463 [Cupriavidus numazuensis]